MYWLGDKLPTGFVSPSRIRFMHSASFTAAANATGATATTAAAGAGAGAAATAAVLRPLLFWLLLLLLLLLLVVAPLTVVVWLLLLVVEERSERRRCRRRRRLFSEEEEEEEEEEKVIVVDLDFTFAFDLVVPSPSILGWPPPLAGGNWYEGRKLRMASMKEPLSVNGRRADSGALLMLIQRCRKRRPKGLFFSANA
jgi:hypothetical protein